MGRCEKCLDAVQTSTARFNAAQSRPGTSAATPGGHCRKGQEPTLKNRAGKSNFVSHIEVEDVLEIIDRELPVELRAYWLRMRERQPLTKVQKKVEEAIKRILKGRL
jgi:hypothetical protein